MQRGDESLNAETRVWGVCRGTAIAALLLASVASADWKQFRGEGGASVAVGAQASPGEWRDASAIAWKADLPGRGLSSPIVIGDDVIVTASSGVRQDRLHVLCFDANAGAKRWERQFWATGNTTCHEKTMMAAPTPTTDGERIFALYSCNDLFCLDRAGNLLWLRGLTHDYPNVANSLGMASSPVVVDGVLVAQLENDVESVAIGLDAATGANRWKIARPAIANWTSPIVAPGATADRHLVLLQSEKGVAAVDVATGETAWNLEKDCSTIPSLALAGDRLYVPTNGLAALKAPAPGRKPELLWEENRLRCSTPSPIISGDRIYALGGNGILKAADANKGEILWQQRVAGKFSGTPVVVGTRLSAFYDEGLALVVALDKEGETIAKLPLGEEMILCSPAVAGDALYVRSDGHLWKLTSK